MYFLILLFVSSGSFQVKIDGDDGLLTKEFVMAKEFAVTFKESQRVWKMNKCMTSFRIGPHGKEDLLNLEFLIWHGQLFYLEFLYLHGCLLYLAFLFLSKN